MSMPDTDEQDVCPFACNCHDAPEPGPEEGRSCAACEIFGWPGRMVRREGRFFCDPGCYARFQARRAEEAAEQAAEKEASA